MTVDLPVLIKIENQVATITLNRPEKANAFDGVMWQALEEATKTIKLDPAVKAVILTGAGKAFCGGLDIKTASTEGISLRGLSFRPGFEFLQYVSAVFSSIDQLPLPVIAAVNGGCIGLGMELALACDLRLAAAGAVFSIPEVAFGLVPDCGGTQRLPRLVGPAMARELIFSGRRISATEALRIGLVNHVYDPGALYGEACHLAKEIAAHPAEAVQAAKRCLNMAMNSTLSSGLEYETTAAMGVLGEKAKTMIKTC